MVQKFLSGQEGRATLPLKDFERFTQALQKTGATVEKHFEGKEKYLQVFMHGKELGGIVFDTTKKKRKPLLIDTFLAESLPFKGTDGKRLEVVKDRLRAAKVFVLDEKAAMYAAEFIRDHPEAIAEQQEFAIPCFPQMYVEFPFIKFFEITNGDEQAHDRELGDTEVGYFFDGPRVYVLVRNVNSKQERAPHIMPMAYRLNQPFTLQEEIAMAERFKVSRMGLDAIYWGSTARLHQLP